MTLQKEELFDSTSLSSPLRMKVVGDGLKVVEFASGSALLPVGMPMALNSSTGKWVVYTKSGSNDTSNIRGFVYGFEVQLSGSGEVLGVILTRGSVYRSDVNTAAILALAAGSPNESDLNGALAAGTPTLRELGIDVLGLATAA